MDNTSMTLYDSERQDIAFAPIEQGLFLMTILKSNLDTKTNIAAAAVNFNDLVWHEHQRLGHLSLQNMLYLAKISTGINGHLIMYEVGGRSCLGPTGFRTNDLWGLERRLIPISSSLQRNADTPIT